MIFIQWGVYLIHFLFFNIGWIYGCRRHMKQRGGFTYGSAATALLLTIISFIFLFSGINKLHLLWITPLISYVVSPFNQTLFSIPVLGSLYLAFVKMFASVITIGVKTNKDFYDHMKNEGFSQDILDEHKRRVSRQIK